MQKKYTDPNIKKEAKKYAIPVPSREYLLEILEDIGVPINLASLIKKLSLSLEEEHEGLRRRLKAMVRDGQLMCDRKKRYLL